MDRFEHLSDAQLEQYGTATTGSSGEATRTSGDVTGSFGNAEVDRHLEDCPECRTRLLQHLRLHFAPLADPSVKTEPTAGCPSKETFQNLAAGLSVAPADPVQLIQHASQCDHCGPLLHELTDIFSDDLSPEDAALLAQLKTSSPEWQSATVAKMQAAAGVSESAIAASKSAAASAPGSRLHGPQDAETQRKRDAKGWIPSPAAATGSSSTSAGVSFFRFPRLQWVLMPTALAACAAIAFSIWWTQRDTPEKVEKLLAQAYTEQRPTDIRFRGADFAPIRVERGPGKSSLSKPRPLLKAEAILSDNLPRKSNDPAWLQAKGVADLLDGNYDSAIESLQKALEAQPASPHLLTDLGTAYYLRGNSAEGAIDLGRAVELYGEALAKAPDDPIALFNRALASEKLSLYTQAVQDWNHYLQVDRQGKWADEARKHLHAAEQQLQQRKGTLTEPLLSPEEFAIIASNISGINRSIDNRIEEYLKRAVTDWLPAAFALPEDDVSHNAQAALARLAAITKELHDDDWLTDLLRNGSAPTSSSGIQTLAQAVRANERGDYAEGRKSAHSATQLFRAAGNTPGEFRAAVEEIYSDHLLWEGNRCLELLRDIDPKLRLTNYAWLKSQLSLERSNCADLVGDEGTYQAAILAGTQEAAAHKYWSLLLRGLGFESLAVNSLGNTRAAFSLASEGLHGFWLGQGDLMKGYNLYTDLDAAADGLHLPNLQMAVWQEATALIDQHSDTLLRAMAHRWFANSAYLAGVSDLAEHEFSKASELFAASPQTVATMRDRMDAEIWLAQIEVRQGDLERSAKRLQEIKPVLDAAPSFGPEIGYYSAMAEIGMRRSEVADTQLALRAAVSLSERALKSLSSQTDRREWATQTRAAYRNAVEWQVRQGNALEGLELWEWYRGAELRASEHPPPHPSGRLPRTDATPPLPSPVVVANRMPVLRSETIIAYATFQDGIAIWAYDDRGLLFRWVPTSVSELQDVVLRFQRLCSDPTSDLNLLRATARSLYNLLAAPIRERLSTDRVIVIEPDDSLAALPWEALLDEKGKYLGQRSSIVISAGLYSSMHLQPETRIDAQTPALVVSVPVAAGFTPLIDAENEASSVVSQFRHAHWLKGANATYSTIRAAMTSSTVFHFAGHAMASSQRTGLVLDEQDPNTHIPRLIKPEDITHEQVARLQLAVLSACNTDIDERAADSSTESLTQRLLHVGIPHVVSSRWNVDSSTTSDFMKQFYGRLLAGENVSTSLHAAQLALASQAVSAHPYYWAAFGVHGLR